MNIWIVNHYALEPSRAGGTRHFSFSRELVARGHRVTILASSVDYSSRVDTRLRSGEDWRRETVDGVDFVWIRTPSYADNSVGKLRNMLAFATRLTFRRGVLPAGRPDVVIGSSPHPFGALAATRLARRAGAPFVLEVRDLWPQSIVDVGGLSERHPFIVAMSALERYLYRTAERIICVPPGVEEHVRRRGGRADRITWIPNGIDLSLVPPAVPPAPGAEFTVAYAGQHGEANALDIALDAMALLQERHPSEPIRLRMIGGGPEKPRLRERAGAMGLSNVEFVDPVPKDRIHAEVQRAHAGLMLLRDSPVFRSGVSPNKLFDYMAVARPVIFGVNTLVNPVAMAGAGITLPAITPEALADAILELARTPPEERAALGARGRAYVEQHHDMARLSHVLEDVLASAVSGAAGR
jgi:glycosyltransferase involved in cell wall biosynthesis